MSNPVLSGNFIETSTPKPGGCPSTGVVFIHGLGGNSNVYFPLRSAIQSEYPTVSIDLTGLGRSNGTGPQGFGDWIIDVENAIAELGEFESVILVGHSLGTLVARHVAAQEPRVKGMVLFAPIAGPDVSQRPAFAARAATARTHGMVRVAHDFGLAALSQHTLNTRPLAVTLVREFLMGQDADRYAECCVAIGEAGEANPPEAPDCSVILVRGAEDAISTTQEVAACEAALRPAHTETVVLKNVAHWPTVEDPESSIAVLQRFLAETAARTATSTHHVTSGLERH
ncbi:alpha/beta hydrolase [Arthrobacter sp. PAMC25564]|uniref:alpha/beta fold hydrolase n=1 Tax=Arthrobacter sp. PAMC25564 TaxID=2565366 RepID=UPI0014463F6A|nr:alpha/beta hydrolase [Arthrobacter sp. PAMC25564]